MSHAYTHFQAVSGSPKPFNINSLFGNGGEGFTSNSDTSQLLQQLIGEVNDQTSMLNELAGAISGKANGSALQSVLGGASFGGSALGGIASAAKGGFSWQSIVSDIFPVGGLISGIASLFDSAPTPPPLEEYAAPPSLNFNAVLNANGTLSQGSTDQYGLTRGSSSGLDLTDAQGGPYSPYQRASNGSLAPAAGNPTTLYNGTLNLPELSQSLVQISPATPAAPASGSSNGIPSTGNISSVTPTPAAPTSVSASLPAAIQALIDGPQSNPNVPVSPAAASLASTSNSASTSAAPIQALTGTLPGGTNPSQASTNALLALIGNVANGTGDPASTQNSVTNPMVSSTLQALFTGATGDVNTGASSSNISLSNTSLSNNTLGISTALRSVIESTVAGMPSPNAAFSDIASLGGMSLASSLQELIQQPIPGTAPTPPQSTSFTTTSNQGNSGAPASATPGVAGLSSTNGSFASDPSNPVPAFDQQWFNDHGSYIATAVRAQLLNYHPIVDTINDL